VTKQSLAQLFRDMHKIEAQVALLRLDLQAAGILPKPVIKIDIDDAPTVETDCEPLAE
jgi:hypothetical protein